MTFHLRIVTVLFAACIAFVVAEPAKAYITPGEFLEGGQMGQVGGGSSSSSSVSSSSSSSAASSQTSSPSSFSSSSSTSIVLPPNGDGAPDDLWNDPRASVFEGNGFARPRTFNAGNLPESAHRSLRIPDRPIEEVIEAPVAPTVILRPIVRRAPAQQGIVPMHNAAQPLAPTGLPLAVPVAMSMVVSCGIIVRRCMRA